MRIGVDIDGVVADTFPLLVAELNSYFRVAVKISDIHQYDLDKFYHVTRMELERFYRDRGELLIECPPPVKGAAAHLRKLARSHEIFLISARLEEWRKKTELWLQKHGIIYHHLFLAGSHDKRDACRYFKVDLFIDDRLENTLQIKECGIPAILMDAPYNRADLPAGIKRCYSWPEIYGEIETMNGGERPHRLRPAVRAR